ncbi:unnamed protein product, partial [Polarella glacialis]
ERLPVALSFSEEARRAFRKALDEDLDALCNPALEKVRRANVAAPGPGHGGLADLVSQLQGLAEVRCFVDEQLASDLGARARACGEMLRRSQAKFPSSSGSQTQPQQRAQPIGSQVLGEKLALAPFRSGSQSMRRR